MSQQGVEAFVQEHVHIEVDAPVFEEALQPDDVGLVARNA
jgi:hypothetical protein